MVLLFLLILANDSKNDLFFLFLKIDLKKYVNCYKSLFLRSISVFMTCIFGLFICC